MYKLVGIGLASILAMMVLPGFNVDSSESSLLYGAATLVAKDINGNPIFEQIIHNQLTDEGEEVIIMNVFSVADGGQFGATNAAIGAICVTDNITVGEAETQATFDADVNTSGASTQLDPDSNNTGGSCISGGANSVANATSGIATIGPHSFLASVSNTANFDPGARVSGIGICIADPSNANATSCGAVGSKLFAVVNVSNVTLAEGETVSIDYEFDITSSGT